MRLALVIAIALAAATIFELRASQAAEGPWCVAQSGRGAGTPNCTMQTFEQCLREITGGTRGHCLQNPSWPASYFTREPARPIAKKRRLRH